MLHIYYHPRPHHIDNLISEDAGRQEIQYELSSFVYYSVACVVSALVAAYHIIILRQKVHHAALSFVSPVYSYYSCKHNNTSKSIL